MKTSLLTSASLMLLHLCSYARADAEDEHLEALFADPKFKPNNLGNVIPGRFIVEFDEEYHGSSLDFVNDVEKDIGSSSPSIKSRIKLSIAQDFISKSAIFNGISIALEEVEDLVPKPEVKSEEEKSLHMQAIQTAVLRKLLKQHRVKHVYPVTEFQRPVVDYLADVQAYKFEDEAVVPTPPNIKLPNGLPNLPFTHPMAQVDKVANDLKLKGEGVLVGIIDSGIDYRHPAFGGGFGPGFQVRVGLDLVGNKFNSKDPLSRHQRNSPLDDCTGGNGHGTHVAGIIAANDHLFNFTGVAPEVTLGAWRVFGCNGATSNDIVIKALIDAHEAGCDVINLSLGSSSNWAEDPTAIVANRVSENGSMVIAAAGNDGSEGAFFISSPGVGSSTIAAASIDNEYNFLQTVQTEEGSEYAYLLSSSTKSFPTGQLVSFSNTDVNNDSCKGTEPDNVLTGKIVLIQRGTCIFDEKADVAQQFGAVGVLIYDNEESPGLRIQSRNSGMPMAAVDLKAGLALKRLLNDQYKENGIKLTFNTALSPQIAPSAHTVSKFSSYGPLYDMTMKPDFAGPGGFIFSTLPIANGGYGQLSGTSMAAPFISGAYALFIQAHGKEKGSTFLKEHFQNYAQPALHETALDNPARQGAGLLQVYDAITQFVHVSPGALSFNDTINMKPQQLTISNSGNETVSYLITHKPAATLHPYNTTLQGYAPLQPPSYATTRVEATLKLSKTTISLEPGESQVIDLRVLRVSPSPQDMPYPIYGGYIQFKPVDNENIKTIHVPYVGIKGSLAELPIFAAKYPRFLVTKDTTLFEETSEQGEKTIGLVIDRSSEESSHVISVFRLLTGTAQSLTEVLDENSVKIGTFSQDTYLSRNSLSSGNTIFTQRWNGTIVPNESNEFDDLVTLPPGLYHLKWKALKLMSDPEQESSWETHISPPVLIKQ